MRDDQIPIPVKDLPAHVQTLLKNREYPAEHICAYQIAQEYAGWNLGDASWANEIIGMYNLGLEHALKT